MDSGRVCTTSKIKQLRDSRHTHISYSPLPPPRRSLAKVAEYIAALGERAPTEFVLYTKEFVDELCHPDNDPPQRKALMIAEQPRVLAIPWMNAMLAAMAEMIAERAGIPVPDWANEPERFLPEPLVFGYSPQSQAMAIELTPAAFARRNLFCGQITLYTNRWEIVRQRRSTG
ncbi:hypothetical protein [Tepidiphilus margaritifer]|uniref:hypothetical protein n=1 Tax=Tepidiphilus margaritifer TaxID=203471 RepID=UPI0004287F30|nr:hypothetical protein [Tepidiphilus margaritifer]